MIAVTHLAWLAARQALAGAWLAARQALAAELAATLQPGAGPAAGLVRGYS